MRQHVNRRDFVKSAVGASIVAPLLLKGTPAHSPGVYGEDQPGAHIYLTPFDYDGVHLLDGMLNKQYVATRDYFFNLPIDVMLLGFRKRSGEPPQWLSAMARMYKATGDKPILDKATSLMAEWGKTLEPNGFYSRHPAPHYAYDKALCGLVDLYHYGGQKDALPLMEKITDWAVQNLDRSRSNPTKDDPDAGHGLPGQGMGPREWYTLSENLYRAYQLTGNSKYKTFGDLWRYPNYWDMFTRSTEPTPYNFHAYSHCNSLSSAAMTYAVTGEAKYLKTIINAYDWFARTQFYATGGYGPYEMLQPPDGSLGKSLESTIPASFETPCGTWAGFKLAKYLMQFTGEARYGDWIEKLVYNCIGAALPMSDHRIAPPASLPGPVAANMSIMSTRGQTFYYSDYLLSGGRKVYHGEPFPCCSGTYSQAVVDYHDLIYFKDASSLFVNLFVPSQVAWDHEGNDIKKVEQATSYPESETTTLHVNPTESAVFNLKVRVPEWCEGASVEINGSKQDVVCKPGTWATLKRRWAPGDLVKVNIPMRPRLVPIDKQHPYRVAVMVGPVVLVRENGSSMVAGERDPSKWILPSGEPLEYRVPSQPTPRFVPFYRVGEGASYGMYFDLQT